MKLSYQRLGLRLTHKWAIASRLGPGGGGGTHEFPVVVLELRDERTGVIGRGEAAPSTRYGESVDSCVEFFERVPVDALDFADPQGSMLKVRALGAGAEAAKGAFDMALLDGHGQLMSRPIHALFGLGFRNGEHLTSFSIGIDSAEVIRQKVLEAAEYPVLKLKVGSLDDAGNLRALREAAPEVWIRLDANEAWKTREEALTQLEALARDPRIQFIEQPMPASTPVADWIWLKQRSPIPLMADESYVDAADAERCADCFHAVNVKLVKTGGVSRAVEALKAARALGLKTMIGCMIETSVLITAAGHLAELADYLDLDGNLLISNDPFSGVTCSRGLLSFPDTAPASGLRVQPLTPGLM